MLSGSCQASLLEATEASARVFAAWMLVIH